MRALTKIVVLFMLIFCCSARATDINTPKLKAIQQYTISIASPEAEETLQNGTQELTVTVSVTPELAKEDKVAIYVDGTQSGDAASSTSITIPPLERGSHTLQAKIIQSKGTGAESSIITVFQQRHSKLLPG